MSAEVIEEVYVHKDQMIYNDIGVTEKLDLIKKIKNSLKKKVIVAELDKEKTLIEFLKIDYAHAIGVMEGRKGYGGVNSHDETWTYEFETEDKIKHGGIAVVRAKRVIDFFPVWQRS